MKRFENYDLSGLNTFRLKARCALYIEYDTVDELKALDYKSLPQPIMHIGAGSNLLFTKDFPGTILHSGVKFIKFVDLGLDEVLMTVGAGVVFDDFVAKTCEAGLWGAENLSLIPGEVGAAAVQNIGAYGVEVKDIIAGVVCLDTSDWSKIIFKTPECRYAYRDSMFKQQKGRYIITSVLFRLTRKYSPKLDYGGLRAALGENTSNLTPGQLREAIIKIRRQKLPDPAEIGNAGSFFKNPVMPRRQYEAIVAAEGEVPHYDLPDEMVKVPAAWMIERCGFKGKRLGGAQVYEKQPLVIINANGEADAQDILDLEKQIITEVKRRFGVELHPEVEHV
jgi:UDP-N-acetylmuramate dehydrogenase